MGDFKNMNFGASCKGEIYEYFEVNERSAKG